MLNNAHRQTQPMVERPHPLCVPLGQIVVHGHQMDASSLKSVEVNRESGDQGFPFTGPHLGDPPLVQDHSPDELDIEMPHSQPTFGHFPADGKGFGKEVIQGFSGFQPLLEGLSFFGKSLIIQRLKGGL